MARLRRNPFQFTLRFLQDFGDECVKLYFYNVESLLSHLEDVKSDHYAMASNILAFVEPHLLPIHDVDIPSHQVLHRANCRQIRNSEGALLLKRTDSGIEHATVTFSSGFTAPGHCLILVCKLADVTFLVIYKHPQYSHNSFL
jgi:hypothetical protein